MNPSLSLTIPCRADEPDLRSTLDSLLTAARSPQLPSGCIKELLICVNGVVVGQPCPPLLAIRDFCARNAVALQEVALSSAEAQPQERPRPAAERPRCVVLLAAWRGKPKAMNTLWQWACGDLLLFCDADVRVDPQAIARLYAPLKGESQLHLVAAREIPTLEAQARVWSRMGALSYRFNFGNVGGRLFLIRKDALSEPMPEDLLLEDAWLTIAVGKPHVRKVMQARVFFVLPRTWHDYFAERVRTEGGKIQIRRQHASLLANGPAAQYPWGEFLRTIRPPEYGLTLFALCVRGLARVWAWRRLKQVDFYTLYRPFTSTKRWSVAAPSSPQTSPRPSVQSGQSRTQS